MCGICGIVDFRNGGTEESVIRAMTAALHHRGPDDAGVFRSGPTALGHTRLSILDLSDSGHQPMFSDCRQVAMVYNGEVYNFRELRQELAREGESFVSTGDAEVILKAFMRWGVACFERFHGMFALAIWDARCKNLYLARDRFGIKPLYFQRFDGNGLVFGSEIKALLASGRVSTAQNWTALHEYLYYGAALGNRTMFQHVEKLPPGTFLKVGEDTFTVQQYARPTDVAPINDDFETAVATVREKLDQAVRAHLISDVPVGVFLSGGVDSSAITALAAKHYHGKLKTYSVGFDFDKGADELPKARQVAQHFGTDHHELHIKGKDMADMLERLVRCHDEPFGDNANIPLYLMCQELKGSVKVILQGDGGDEIFGGYHRYSRLQYAWFWRLLGKGGSLLKGVIPTESKAYRALRTAHALAHPDPSKHMALLMAQEHPDYPPEQFFKPEIQQVFQRTNPFQHYQECAERFAGLDPVQRMLYTDTSIILPNVYFEKVDKATMANSIEIRVPLVDTELARYVMALPSRYKVKGNEKKYLLRKALRGIVPDSILDAPKAGFGVPFQAWLRGPLAEYTRSVLLDPQTLAWGLFDEEAVTRCLDAHEQRKRNNGFIINKLLNLALWHRFYQSGAGPDKPTLPTRERRRDAAPA